MKVFCPSCAHAQEGQPGARLTCPVCTSSFEVPRGEAAPQQAPPAPAPPPPVQQLPTGYVGPPATGFGGGGEGNAPLNGLAITSLVLGILCCVPFASIGAVITGAIAHKQITEANGRQRGRELAMVGMILGVLGAAAGIISLMLRFLGRLH